jgi:PAS domain S-box-containing protein
MTATLPISPCGENATLDLTAAIDAANAPPEADQSWAKRQDALLAIGRKAGGPAEIGALPEEAAVLLADSLAVDCCGVAERAAESDRILVSLRRLAGPPDQRRPEAMFVPAEPNDSLAGQAWTLRRAVASPDLAAERRFHDAVLLEQGLRAAVAAPVVVGDQVDSVLMAAARSPREFSPNDLLFAEMLAQLLAANIGKHAVLEELENQRRLSSSILSTVAALVLVLDSEGRIVELNRAGEELTGFSLDEVQGRFIGEVFPVDGGQSKLYERIFAKLRRSTAAVEYESHVATKQSDRRRIAWSYAGKRRCDGQVDSIVVTGIDVTRQREAEERAARAEKLADELSAPDGSQTERLTESERHPSTGTEERRRRPRLAYSYRQLIAPIVNGKLPSRQDFVELECHDIAVGGFSYYSPTPPASDQVVIALGIPPRLTFLIAQIVHVRRVTRDAKSFYLTGCMYTGRAEY